MKSLTNKIKSLEKSEINNQVNSRLKQFQSFKNKSSEEWFSELCFCILAANSKQKTSEAIQKQLSIRKINNMTTNQLAQLIKNNKHRFHNNKANYLKKAIDHKNIKSIIKSQQQPREWLVKNVKGIGYKESSHFLRNTGHDNLAILDRHILNVLSENKIIKKPKTLTPKNYLEIEKKFISLSKKLKMSPAKLDLFLWYTKTGEVLK